MTPLLAQQPWLVLALHTLFSAGGLFCQLQDSKEGRASLKEAEKLWELGWSGGADVDLDDARRLGGEVLEAASRTQLGTFFAASLAAGCAAGVTLATKALFLGQLSEIETSRLAERLLKFAMLKVVALAVCAPTHAGLWRWLAWTVVMGQAWMFVKLASLRGDALLCSPRATPGQHLRILALLGGILAQDVSWIAGYIGSGMSAGSLSHASLWLFDAAFVAVDASYSLAKYAVHALDHWQAAQAEARGEEREPWEGRSALVYWLELAADLTLQGLMLAHYLHLWWLHGLQLQLIDGVLLLDVRHTLGVLRRRLAQHTAYRRLQHRLRHAFPDATAAQLEAGPCCICLCSMKAGKQLPCSHAMHSSCLAAWLQQSRAGSFTCPLCRASLDMQPPPPKPAERSRWLEAGIHHLEAGLQRLGDGIERLVAPAGANAAPAGRLEAAQAAAASMSGF
ncbi:hypothetical protein ABPG75_007766 [Micractinium tetrahymenae]